MGVFNKDKYPDIYKLREMGNMTGVKGLIKALHHKEYSARFGAAEALGSPFYWGNKFKKGSHDKVRAMIIKNLIPMLKDEHQDVRMHTIKSLTKLWSSVNMKDDFPDKTILHKSALDAAIPLLKDKNSRIRLETAYLLSEIGDPSVIEPIAETLLEEPLEHQDEFYPLNLTIALKGMCDDKCSHIVRHLCSALNEENVNSNNDELMETLQKITGEHFSQVKEWKEWFEKNKENFQ
jgi:HEAT repeat protein